MDVLQYTKCISYIFVITHIVTVNIIVIVIPKSISMVSVASQAQGGDVGGGAGGGGDPSQQQQQQQTKSMSLVSS